MYVYTLTYIYIHTDIHVPILVRNSVSRPSSCKNQGAVVLSSACLQEHRPGTAVPESGS